MLYKSTKRRENRKNIFLNASKIVLQSSFFCRAQIIFPFFCNKYCFYRNKKYMHKNLITCRKLAFGKEKKILFIIYSTKINNERNTIILENKNNFLNAHKLVFKNFFFVVQKSFFNFFGNRYYFCRSKKYIYTNKITC